VMHPKQGYEPVILWVTGLLTFMAGLIHPSGSRCGTKARFVLPSLLFQR